MLLSKLLLPFVAAVALVACAPSSSPGTGGASTTTAPQAKPLEGDTYAAVEGKMGGVIRWSSYSDPTTMDPHTSTNSATQNPTGAMYGTLLQMSPYDPNQQVIRPYLAEKWEISPDGKTFTLSLRKGVKWHDGEPFTAEDAKFSLLRQKDPDSVNPKPGMFSGRKTWFEVIDTIETPDPYTLRIRLKQPSAFFLFALAAGPTSMVPKHVVMREGDLSKVAVGTGPFKLKKWTRGVSVEMERNPDFFIPGRPYLDGQLQLTVPDQSTEFAAFRAGQIDYVGVPDKVSLDSLKREFGDKINYYKTRATSGLSSLKILTTKPPFNDLRVRKAIDLAIDRDELIKVIADGDAVISGPMPGGGPWALPEAELRKLPGYRQPKDLDIADAKKLLAEAGYSASNPLRFSSMLGMTRDGDRVSELVAGQLKKIGIIMDLKPTERAQIYTAWETGNYEAGWLTAGLQIEDPDDFLGIHYYSQGPRNYAKWKDDLVDELFLKQQMTLDPKERLKLVNQLERRIIELAPYPLAGYNANSDTAIWTYVKNLYPPLSKNTRSMTDVWFDK